MLVCALIGMSAHTLSRPAPPAVRESEASALRRTFESRFGAHKNSQGPEEWIVRDFFNDRRGGVFLDVGASHYRHESNTYYLETALGWSGVAIDALPQFGQGYAQHRPRTAFVNAFVSDRADARATLFVGLDNTEVSSTRPEFTEQFTTRLRPVDVMTTTLDLVLAQRQVDRVDFVSLDIELHEPQALAGFSITRFKPALVCVEAHPEVRQALLDYFQASNYRLVGKYLRLDTLNLWFQPADGPAVDPASHRPPDRPPS